MADSQLVIGQLSDGKYVAASTSAPFFCTVGDSVEAVRQRATEAVEFYQNATALTAPIAPYVTQVERVIPYKVDAWLADTAMNAA